MSRGAWTMFWRVFGQSAFERPPVAVAFKSGPTDCRLRQVRESSEMREHLFQVQDFWTAGLGCDLGGAFLLARGLINRPAELTRLAGSFWGSNHYQALSVARNRNAPRSSGVFDCFTGQSAN